MLLEPEPLEAGGGGLVLPAWEPSTTEVAAGEPAGDRLLPAPDAAVPEELIPESEVDEWVAFVEGLPAGRGGCGTTGRRPSGGSGDRRGG